MNIEILCDKNISTDAFIALMASVGWGDESDYSADAVRRSIANYPFVAHARTDDDRLIGYISAFSDGAFSVFIGELVVHPEFQRRGVGGQLLQAVETRFPGVPVFVKPFVDQTPFFLRNGYAAPQRPMAVLTKRNGFAG